MRFLIPLVSAVGLSLTAFAQNHYEEFTGPTNEFDLDRQQLVFTWTGNDYTQTRENVLGFPIDPASHQDITSQMMPDLDDGSVAIALSGGKSVSLFGTSYTTVYVNANGNLSFGSGSSDQQPFAYFNVPRIAGVYSDLDLSPERSRVHFAQLSDRIVVSYVEVEQAASPLDNSFQIEVALDDAPNAGEIKISLVDVDSGIDDLTFPVWIGLSSGTEPTTGGEDDFTLVPNSDGLRLDPAAPYRAFGLAGFPEQITRATVPSTLVVPLGTSGVLTGAAAEAWANAGPIGQTVGSGPLFTTSGFFPSQVAALPAGEYTSKLTYTITSTGGLPLSLESQVIMTLFRPDALTEVFQANDFDLEFTAVEMTPDASASGYSTTFDSEVMEFLVDPAFANIVILNDNAYTKLTPAAPITFYGQSYSSIYLCSNGRVTFTDPGRENPPSPRIGDRVTEHFSTPGISMLYHNLDPSIGFSGVSYQETTHSGGEPRSFVITFEDVPNSFGSGDNSFQLEMFYDSTANGGDAGKVRLTWLEVETNIGVVGLSDGVDRAGIVNDAGPFTISIASNFRSYPSVDLDNSSPATLDFGDFPDSIDGYRSGDFSGGSLPDYRTRLADNGPRHIVVPGLSFPANPTNALPGINIDAELDGQPSADALGDDAAGGDDETRLSVALTNQTIVPYPSGDGGTLTLDFRGQIPVENTTGTDANVQIWVDLNLDGAFNTATELAQVSSPVVAGDGSFTHVSFGFQAVEELQGTCQLNKALRVYPIRARISTDMMPFATGPASDGEVEDHLVKFHISTIDFCFLPDPDDDGMRVPGIALPGSALPLTPEYFVPAAYRNGAQALFWTLNGTRLQGSSPTLTTTQVDALENGGELLVEVFYEEGVTTTLRPQIAPLDPALAAIINASSLPLGMRLPHLDGDGDGTDTITELAFGSAIDDAASRPNIQVSLEPAQDGGAAHLLSSYLRRTGGSEAGADYTASGIHYRSNGSMTLGQWSDTLVEKTTNPPGLPTPPTGYEWVSYRLSTDTSETERGFIRHDVQPVPGS